MNDDMDALSKRAKRRLRRGNLAGRILWGAAIGLTVGVVIIIVSDLLH